MLSSMASLLHVKLLKLEPVVPVPKQASCSVIE